MNEEYTAGEYILENKLGVSGMCDIWRARHATLDITVAVKFLRPEFNRNPTLKDRFANLSKSESLIQLRHPNIVLGRSVIQPDGVTYLIMPYIEGEDLETRLRGRHPFNLNEVHSISTDIFSALDHAHSLDIIHGTLEPDRILLDRNSHAYLLGFASGLSLRDALHQTRQGSSGNPYYMSPEQICRPREMDARSDIYSFACILYQLLCGSPPFGAEGDSAFQICDCHVRTQPPPLRMRNRAISAGVEQVVLKCLEKDPKDRFSSCGEAMKALDAAIAG